MHSSFVRSWISLNFERVVGTGELVSEAFAEYFIITIFKFFFSGLSITSLRPPFKFSPFARPLMPLWASTFVTLLHLSILFKVASSRFTEAVRPCLPLSLTISSLSIFSQGSTVTVVMLLLVVISRIWSQKFRFYRSIRHLINPSKILTFISTTIFQ